MTKEYENYVKEDLELFISIHKKMFSFEPEMVKFLKQIAFNSIPLDKEYFIGDIACGLGEISYHLKDFFPNSKFLGIDISEEQIKAAKEIFKQFGLENRYNFEVGDIAKDTIICTIFCWL